MQQACVILSSAGTSGLFSCGGLIHDQLTTGDTQLGVCPFLASIGSF